MNREEFIAKLQMVYVGDRNAFNEIVKKHEDLVSYACDLEDEICNLKEENQRLNNVLNELEKWVYQFREEHKNDTGIFDKFLTTREVLDKLNELKESDK